MNTPQLLSIALVTALLPAGAFAAKDGKVRKRPAAASETHAAIPDIVKSYDKNGNHQIDLEELTALQKDFAELRKLDKNSNGEIELAEVTPPAKSPSMEDRRSRMAEGFKKVDKNGNGKIDEDEIEALQKMVAGGRILKRLDENGNGKLEPNEIERLNQHMQQFAGANLGSSKGSPSPGVRRRPGSDTATKPDEKKPEEKKAEEKKPAETKLEDQKFDPKKDPFVPPPPAKP